MLITINLSSPSTSKLPPQIARLGNDELFLIELQGALEVECNHPRDRDGQVVGQFAINEDSSRPTLTIGHHLLEGKIITLPKPLAVIRAEQKPLEENADDGASVQANREWNVVAVVKKKIVFGKRPTPIVGVVPGF